MLILKKEVSLWFWNSRLSFGKSKYFKIKSKYFKQIFSKEIFLHWGMQFKKLSNLLKNLHRNSLMYWPQHKLKKKKKMH